MSEGLMIFLGAQTLSVIGSVFIAYMKTHVAIAELKTQNNALTVLIDGLKSDHKSLQDKVDGISRHVALIEGMEMEKAKQQGMSVPQAAQGSGK